MFFCESVIFMSVLSTISINWFVMTCWINFDDLFYNKWYKLKSFNKMCFVSISFIHILILDKMLIFFVDKKNVDEKL